MIRLPAKFQVVTSALAELPQKGQKLLSRLPFPGLKKEAVVVKKTSTRLACDFGRTKIALLEIDLAENQVKILRSSKFARPVEKDKIPEVLSQALSAGGFGPKKVRISLKGQGVVVRFIQFPKMKPEELRSALTFEAEKYIPFKSDEVVIDFAVLEDSVTGPQGVMMNLLLVAVKKDEIYPLIQTFQAAGLETELIDIDALAFLNAVEFFYPDLMRSSTSGILDIGSEISTLCIVREGKPRFIRDISYGAMDILKRLKRKLGLTDESALKILEGDKAAGVDALSVFKEGLDNLIADLRVSLDYYMDQGQTSEPIKTIFLGGGGSCHPIVSETLTHDLGVTVQTMDILGKIQRDPAVDEKFLKVNQGILPIALGLCLRDL